MRFQVTTAIGAMLALWLFGACGESYTQSALEVCNSPPPRQGLTWTEARGDRICVFTRSDVARRDSDGLAELLEDARANAVSLMGVRDTAGFFRVLLLPSRAAIVPYAGRELNAVTNWGQRTIAMVYSESPNRLAIRHETMHVINEILWPGPRPAPWVQEGLGVLAGRQCSGYTPRAVAAFLLAAGQLPSLQDLRDQFWELDEITGHLASASFMGFVRATYGSDGLRTLWYEDLGGLIKLASVPLVDLESAWRDYLGATPQDGQLADWSSVAQGCYWVEDAA